MDDLTERQKAFNDFFAAWSQGNPLGVPHGRAKMLTRLELAHGATAAGWNAALAWAAKQIGEKPTE
jgi:hypothetical protein